SAVATVPGRQTRGVTVTLVGSTENAIGGVWDIVKGSSLPLVSPAGSPPPLIVSTGMASQLQLEPGASLQIRVTLPGVASALPAIDCRIVGIGHFTFESSDEYTVATTMEGFAAVHGAEDRDSALLVGTGGIAALPLGGVLAVALDRILRGMPGVPARLHFFVFEPRTVLLYAALLGATGVLAALYPIWLAARLPIAATLRREIIS